MTEAEWLACADSHRMLDFLRGWISERQLRLFAVACCRHIWPLLTDEQSRRAVVVAEQFADGMADEDALRAAGAAASDALQAAGAAFSPADPRVGILAAVEYSAWDAARAAPTTAVQCAQPIRGVFFGQDISWSCAEAAAWEAIASDATAWDAAANAESAAQAALLRDLFGVLPFRPVSVNPDWLTWNGGTVAKLAQVIYEERRFQDLPILADALEEAGCTNADLLDHCRRPGEHVRGCWAVDLLLGKE
jgi:hypothetical protein